MQLFYHSATEIDINKSLQKSTTSTALDDESEDQNISDQDSTSSESDSDSIDKGKLFKMLFDSYKKSKSHAKRRKAKKKAKKEAKKSAIADSYLDPDDVGTGASQGGFATPHNFIKKRSKNARTKDTVNVHSDSTILVSSLSSSGSSLKDAYNVLPDTDETINVTDSSDNAAKEAKPEALDDILNDSIFNPVERLETNTNKHTLPNKNIFIGKRRLCNLKISAIHRDKHCAIISNRYSLAINNFNTESSKIVFNPNLKGCKNIKDIIQYLRYLSLIIRFFDFLRVQDSMRLTQINYSHNKAKVFNSDSEAVPATNNDEENKSKNKEMETDGSNKMEHDDRDLITKYHAATATPININIVYYPMPHSLLSPNNFSVYVIQVSQSYVTL